MCLLSFAVFHDSLVTQTENASKLLFAWHVQYTLWCIFKSFGVKENLKGDEKAYPNLGIGKFPIKSIIDLLAFRSLGLRVNYSLESTWVHAKTLITKVFTYSGFFCIRPCMVDCEAKWRGYPGIHMVKFNMHISTVLPSSVNWPTCPLLNKRKHCRKTYLQRWVFFSIKL